MARVYKCDKCKKLIKNGDNFGISISDEAKLMKNERGYMSFDLCSKCGKSLAGYLEKFFVVKQKNKK